MSWSLHTRTEDEDSFVGGVLSSGKKLEPLKFSNGKTQESVVEEIKAEIAKGQKIIFVRGVCGSGKSAIALNLAKNYKRTSIVVPIKSLQEQYERDYTRDKFVLKEDKKPLDIAVIKGRGNFRCAYSMGEGAGSDDLPCTIEIKEKNLDPLLNFIEENPLVEREDFSEVKDVKRMNIAPVCPYWSPLMPVEINPKGLDDVKKIKFQTVSGKEFALFQRKKGCPYYEQYANYATADVLIFNSAKYLIELDIGRKPKTDIEIIDECDEFLDKFANEKRLHLNRLLSALMNLNPDDSDKRNALKEMVAQVNDFIYSSAKDVDCEKIKGTAFSSLIDTILENPNLAEDEELNYYNTAVEIARSFEKILDETYISVDRIQKDSQQKGLFGKSGNDAESVILNLVSINLADKMKDLVDSTNCLVLMSGTLHSEEVLRDIFGIKEFTVIEAEVQAPGKINVYRTGLERNCSYANFMNGTVTRERYLKMLDCAIANCDGQTVVHVNAFSDLPSEEEMQRLKFDNLITREELTNLQKKSQVVIDEFCAKKRKILFTTRCSRGVDFAGDKCDNVVMTKFPYPNIQGLFWKILKKEQPQKFREFYVDRANRELTQKIARGVRFKGDKVNLLSPDSRVLSAKLN